MLRSPEPTAEQVIQATEAAYLLRDRADLPSIARFMALDVSVQHQRQQVEHAILVAAMLKLAVPKGRSGKRYSFSPLVPLLVNARNEDKRVLFGVHLNQFEPFAVFVDRLRAGNPPQQAALQVCAVHDFTDDPIVAWRAFESWGTYAGSLVRAQDGQYAPAEPFGALGPLGVRRRSSPGWSRGCHRYARQRKPSREHHTANWQHLRGLSEAGGIPACQFAEFQRHNADR
jgi:hypothetical protein